MAGGPDVHSRRRPEHHGPHPPGPQAAQRGDNTIGQPGADGIALTLVVKDDDANLPEDFRPDVGAHEVIGCEWQVPSVRLTASSSCREMLSGPIAAPAGQGHIGPGEGIFSCPDDGAHEPERLDPLLVGEDADHLTPEHLLQDVEYFLGLRNVGTGGETARRHLLARSCDRLGAALLHAPQDKLEQMPDIAAALLRAGRMTAYAITPFERGNRFADHPLPGTGESS